MFSEYLFLSFYSSDCSLGSRGQAARWNILQESRKICNHLLSAISPCLHLCVCVFPCVNAFFKMPRWRCLFEKVTTRPTYTDTHFSFFFTVMLRPSAFQEASPHAGICMNQCAQQTLSQFWHHSGIMSVQLCFDFRSKIDNCLWHLCFFFNYSFPKFTEVVKLLIRKHLISVNFPEEQSHWWIYNVSQW